MITEQPVFPAHILTEEMFLEQFAAPADARTATGSRSRIVPDGVAKGQGAPDAGPRGRVDAQER